MEIREFRESDKADVIALWTQVFPNPAPHNDPESVIRHKLAVDRELFFVATLGGELIGTVMGGYDGHRGWGYLLAVDERFRGRGHGRTLVEHVERELAARGCPKINLQVLASNAQRVGFYQTLGYQVEDRISMGKVL